jgi:hypothetical protein
MILGVPIWGTDDFNQPPSEGGPAIRLEPGGHYRSAPVCGAAPVKRPGEVALAAGHGRTVSGAD